MLGKRGIYILALIRTLIAFLFRLIKKYPCFFNLHLPLKQSDAMEQTCVIKNVTVSQQFVLNVSFLSADVRNLEIARSVFNDLLMSHYLKWMDGKALISKLIAH